MTKSESDRLKKALDRLPVCSVANEEDEYILKEDVITLIDLITEE